MRQISVRAGRRRPPKYRREVTDVNSRNGDEWLPECSADYAANTGHHRQHDDWYLESFPARPTDRLLDVGCGSGDFTAKVAALVPGGEVVGVDPQPSLLVEAGRVAAPNQRFVRGTAQRLGAALAAAGQDLLYDGVFSRAALQWVPMADHPSVLAGVHDVLRSGGWFRLEMGGAGNVAGVVALLDDVSAILGGPTSPWAFPGPGRYLELLEEAGFSVDAALGGYVRSVPQRRAFSRDALLGWFRSQAFQAYEIGLPEASRAFFRAEVEGRLDEVRRHDGTLDQTFVRLDLLAHRPAR